MLPIGPCVDPAIGPEGQRVSTTMQSKATPWSFTMGTVHKHCVHAS
jgi:hypothetical protein